MQEVNGSRALGANDVPCLKQPVFKENTYDVQGGNNGS